MRHVVHVTNDGTTVKLYVDGKLVTDVPPHSTVEQWIPHHGLALYGAIIDPEKVYENQGL